MGIEIIDPEYGFPCSACFPTGLKPKYVYVFLSGIVLRPGLPPPPIASPPNGFFKLEEDNHHPCYWKYVGGIWRVDYTSWRAGAPGNNSELSVTGVGVPFRNPFWGFSANQCVYKFQNSFTEPDMTGYYDGSGWVFAM